MPSEDSYYKAFGFINIFTKKIITKWADFITKRGNYVITFWADILLQNAAAFLLQNEPFLLQNAAVITKGAVYYKTGHNKRMPTDWNL